MKRAVAMIEVRQALQAAMAARAQALLAACPRPAGPVRHAAVTAAAGRRLQAPPRSPDHLEQVHKHIFEWPYVVIAVKCSQHIWPTSALSLLQVAAHAPSMIQHPAAEHS